MGTGCAFLRRLDLGDAAFLVHDHAPAHDRRRIAAEVIAVSGIEIGIVPSGAVIPEDQQVVARGILVHAPPEELAQDLGVARVGLSQVLHRVLGEVGALAQVEALGRPTRAGAIELGDHVH
jgi:hypothetical protein